MATKNLPKCYSEAATFETRVLKKQLDELPADNLQVALPELDGGIEPIVFAGRDSNTGKSHSLPDRIDSLCSRAINWAK